MAFAIVLICTAAASFALKPAIKKVPWAWYAASVLLVAAYIAGVRGVLPAWADGAVFLLMQKGTLATALFVVVMFIGVFPQDSKVRRRLGPIRAELSIVACILILGHVIAYGMSFLPRMFGAGHVAPFAFAGICIALVLVVLGAVLGVTSLGSVKARMSARAWTKVQKLAYAFYALTFLHIVAMLAPSASAGGVAAVQGITVYSVVFVGYAVARIARAVLDKRGSSSSAKRM